MTFLPRPPLEKALDLVDRDLKNKSLTPTELRWLHDHPVTWLQALQEMRREVQAHIARTKLNLGPLKPGDGEQPSAQYLEAKREVDQRVQRQQHFLSLVERRQAEVRICFRQVVDQERADFSRVEVPCPDSLLPGMTPSAPPTGTATPTGTAGPAEPAERRGQGEE